MADGFTYFGDASMTETETFGILIVYSTISTYKASEWKAKAKPDLKAYTSLNDSRLTVRTHTHVPLVPKLINYLISVVRKRVSIIFG